MNDWQQDNDEGGARTAGILVPFFSIRTGEDLGIGDTEGVRQFIDFAAEQGYGFLQLLPINELGPDNSPYNAISSVALEPLTINCLPGKGLPDLSEEAFRSILDSHQFETFADGPVNYEAVRSLKRDLLEEAYYQFKTHHIGKKTNREAEFVDFCSSEEDWLDDYAVYRFIMELEQQNPDWQTWRDRCRTPEKAREFIESSIQQGDPYKAGYWLLFYCFIQWTARTQWKEVADYGRQKGVQLMGDIPIGISVASSDVFSDREIFDLDWYGGAPPEQLFKDDEFVQKWGQNWGIPLYRWDVLRDQGYRWWRQRVSKTAEICDLFRVDHALGFYRIYSFPWNPKRNAEFLPLSHDEAAHRCGGRYPGFRPRPDDTDENKQDNRRDGEEYLSVLKEAAGDSKIIAEDLGTVPDYVRPSLASLGIAGIKVPQWEFTDGRVTRGSEYEELSFAAYTTHDHAPLKVQWDEHREIIIKGEPGSQPWNDARHFITTLLDYCAIGVTQFDDFPRYDRNFLDALFWTICQSRSRWVAMLTTDLLYSGDRINVPGVMSDANWTYRIPAKVSELRESNEWQWMRDMSKNILNETGRAIKVAETTKENQS